MSIECADCGERVEALPIHKCRALKPCPFCGEVPDFPSGDGTQYEIECECGMARSSIQISDLMTHDERMRDKFIDYRYDEEFVERAKNEAAKDWNSRAPISQ